MKSHRNVLETFDELLGAARTPRQGKRQDVAGSGGATSHGLRPAFEGLSGRHRPRGSPASSVVPHPPVPRRPPNRHEASRRRLVAKMGARDSLSPSNHRLGAVGRSIVRRTEEQNRCSVFVSGLRTTSPMEGAAATIPGVVSTAPFRHRIGQPRLSAPRSPPLVELPSQAGAVADPRQHSPWVPVWPSSVQGSPLRRLPIT